MKTKTFLTVISLLALFVGNLVADPSGTAFTYQGRLQVSNSPANAVCDFQFSLWDAMANGAPVSATQTVSSVTVSSGLFAVTLDFGTGAFNGDGRWLEIGVRTNGSGAFTMLNPRQKLTPTPYAITAGNFTGTLPSGQLGGIYGNAVTFNNAANSFTGNGTALTGVNAGTLGGLGAAGFWQLAGNAGTTAGVNFLGTTDNQPLEFKVNGNRTLRLDVNGNIVGGSSANNITTNALYAVIAGGSNNIIQASAAVIGGGHDNAIQTNAANSTIAGGRYNSIQTNADVAVMGGGDRNSIQTGADATTIGGGSMNTIQTNADYATIGGGVTNTVGAHSSTIGGGHDNAIQTNAPSSTIAGGRYNSIQANANVATIGGGEQNTIQFGADATTISGGDQNTIRTNADWATIGGGHTNTIWPNAYSATIAGGYSNAIQAGALGSTISGGRNNAIQTSATFSTIGGGSNNLILANATYATIAGGNFNTAGGLSSFAAGNGAEALHNGTFVWSDSTAGGIYSGAANQFIVRASGGVYLFSDSGVTVGAYLPAGGNAFSPMSDRNVKENFQPVDPREVLEKVSRLPVTEWNLKTQSPAIRHIGPMAQDFAAAFGMGEDDRHISTSDADGVALAAIKGLNEIVKEKDDRIQALEKDMADLKAMVKSLLQKSSGGAQ